MVEARETEDGLRTVNLKRDFKKFTCYAKNERRGKISFCCFH